MTNRDRWKKRPVVVAYFAFRDEVRARGLELPIPAKVIFWMPMPKGWSDKKKREMGSLPHLVRPDLSNMLKALEDAVFYEDSCVWSVWPEKRWAIEPGIEVIPLPLCNAQNASMQDSLFKASTLDLFMDALR